MYPNTHFKSVIATSIEDIPVEEKTFLDAIAESEGNTFSAAVAAFGLSCQLPGTNVLVFGEGQYAMNANVLSVY
jgi:hypothetical protein